MSVETIVANLLHKKVVGREFRQLQAFGQELVRPGDQWFVLRHAEAAGSDLLRLVLAVNPMEGADDSLAELVVEKPGQVSIGDAKVEFTGAAYVRFQETALVVKGADVVATERGRPGSTFPRPAGPSLLLA